MSRSLTFFILTGILITVSCNDTPYMQGKRLYAANCQNCHMEDGSGLANLIPPLTVSPKLGDPQMFCIIMNGIRDTIRQDSSYLVKEMPAFRKLSGTEITNIVNYVNHRWAGEFKEMNIFDAEMMMNNCAEKQ